MNCFSRSIHNLKISLCPVLSLFCLLSLQSLVTSGGECAALQKTRSTATQRPYVIKNHTYYPLPSAHGYEETGIASWYGKGFHGHSTSNGEIYNMHDATAAHKLLPMGTMLLVTNLKNGKQTVVRVNDRGPFAQGRIIDLSYTAAQKIGLIHSGTAKVTITALGEVKRIKGKIQYKKKYAELKSGQYYVQIGAFANKFNSIRLQEKFIDAGHRAVIKKTTFQNGKVIYKVWVFVGRTLNSARKSEQALLDKGYKGAFIIAL